MHYFDYAATTPMLPNVLEKMMPYLTVDYGNAGSPHLLGLRGKRALRQAREQVAHFINADPEEIFFTSGGTESNNWFIQSCLHACRNTAQPKRLMTGMIEHHSILETAKFIEAQGVLVDWLPVTASGHYDLTTYEQRLNREHRYISLMYVNNEVGTVQPLQSIVELAHQYGAWVHTDAVQAAAHLKIDVKALDIDCLSLSAHKFGGPKGIGALYIKKGINLPPLLYGGMQERLKRAGTEPIAQIVGMAEACQTTAQYRAEHNQAIARRKQELLRELLSVEPGITLNGVPDLPAILNLTHPHLTAEQMIQHLNAHQIAVSSGAACTSGRPEPSHVLQAMGIDFATCQKAIRISLSHTTTSDDIHALVQAFKKMKGQL